MIRTVIALISFLTLLGCTHTKTIPTPTEKWTYCRIDDFEECRDADYCLLLSFHLEEVGDIGQQTIFFKKQSPRAPKNKFSLGSMSFADGDGWSGFSNFDTEINETSIILHTKGRHSSEDVNYEFEENLNITYLKTGNSSSGELSYRWEWVKLDTTNQWKKLSDKTSIDWLKVFSEKVETEIKQISPNQLIDPTWTTPVLKAESDSQAGHE